MSFYDKSLGVPEEIARKALDLQVWMREFGAVSIYGMGDVLAAHRQLDECKVLLAEGQALIRAQAEEIERLNNLVQEKQTLLEFAEATVNLLRPPARTC